MRILGLFIALLVAGVSFAQNNIVQLKMDVKDDGTGKSLGGATMEILQDGKPFENKTSASNGKFPIVDLPINHVYSIYIKKEGYVTKLTEVNTLHSYPEDLPPIIYQQMEVNIFQKVEGVDFTFLETTPMAKFEINRDGYMDYDKAYTSDMLKKIELLKQEMEKKRLENEKKEAEKQKQQADYNAYMKAGNDAMTALKYDVAITQYELALKTIPGDATAQTKLDEAKKLKADKEQADAKQKEFATKMEQAKIAYTEKRLEDALKLYKEANALMPNEALPKERIATIETELAKQKESEENYKKFMNEGETALTAKLYDDAIAKFTSALGVKPNDPTAQSKLDQAKKLKLEKEQADAKQKELEAKYTGLMKEADAAFNSQNYELAKTKYTEALTVKPADPTATAQLAKIDEIIKKKQEEQDAAQKKEADYQKAMKDGEALFTQKNYEGAKQKFNEALGIKPNDAPALAKIDLCNKEMEKMAADAKMNEDYNRAMTEAKALFDQKKYAEAKQKYQEALNVKPLEQEPKTKIAEIEKLIQDQEKLAQQEKDYQNFMTEGDQLTGIKDYMAAIDRYNKALGIKPGDPSATQKIAEINKILDEQKKQAEQEKKFSDYMAKADQAFNAKDYTNAKLNYQEAFKIKADPAITEKIKAIDDIIAKNQSESERQAKYDAAMKEADALYKANNLEAALAKYKEASVIKDNETAPKQKISEIETKLAAQKQQAEQDQKFKDFVAAGDAAFTAKDYQKALASYQEALKIKTDPTISQKVGQLNTLIAEQTQNQQTEERYKAKIDQADAAYNSKGWETAREFYREALMIKPNDTYATSRISDIEKQMQAETDQEVEKNYQKIITKADALKGEERFDEAISYYQNALNLKPTDEYPKKQIEEIKRIQNERANQKANQEKLEAEYTALIKEADMAFNTQNWTVALAKYKEALLKKPNETHPQSRIAEINEKINSQNQQNQADTDYNKYIAQADALFKDKKYLDAISAYRQALTAKPNDAYALTQIDEATRLEQSNTVSEEEAQYQNLLNVAQKKFDEGDYAKALELYKRALGLRPQDPLPQKRISEINQILDNKSKDTDFEKYKLQADTYFEKGDWKNAKAYYEKALGVKDDAYCASQIEIINQKMKSETNQEIDAQYQKLIAKADEYFDAKNYEKAKELYERALGFKKSDEHARQRLDEIDRILHPDKYVTKSNGLPDYGDPVNTSTVDIEALLLEAEEQRDYQAEQKAQQQRESAENANEVNAIDQTDISFETSREASQIKQDLDEQEWSAEVKRTEANLEVIDMQDQLVDVSTEQTTDNENVVQLQNQNLDNLEIEMELREVNSDRPREEYLADVEHIKVEVVNEIVSSDRDQTDATYLQKEVVNDIQEEHISEDPNNDVARKNNEVYVEDLEIRIINKNNQDTWSQENEVMAVKDHTEVLTDERIANSINDDIPREETAETIKDYKFANESMERSSEADQYNEMISADRYVENMEIQIEVNNMDNDIPRQNTELKVDDAELSVSDFLEDHASDQNAVVNRSDDKLDNIEIGIENDNKDRDRPREDYERDVVQIDDAITDNQESLSKVNENNVYITKDQTEKLTSEQVEYARSADAKATKNSDETADAVEDIVEKSEAISEGNTEEVNEVEDYVDELKHLPVITDETVKPNELGQKYPEGVTEEVYAINDENGLLSKYIVRRIVVVNGTGYCYEKVQTRYGSVSYTRDGEPIAEYQWTDETEAATLTRN